MSREYQKKALQQELENNGPGNVIGFHKLDLLAYNINPDYQNYRFAHKEVEKVLQPKVWDLAYPQVKFGVDTKKTNLYYEND